MLRQNVRRDKTSSGVRLRILLININTTKENEPEVLLGSIHEKNQVVEGLVLPALWQLISLDLDRRDNIILLPKLVVSDEDFQDKQLPNQLVHG